MITGKMIWQWLAKPLTTFFSVVPVFALAKLPKPDVDGADKGDYITAGLSLFTQIASGSIMLLYFVCGVAFLAVVYFKFNEARRNNEWGNFSLVFAVGLILLVMALVILNAIKGAIEA